MRRHTEPFGRLGQAGSLDEHMARFAFEALEIELTEGQPDTSANKQTKRKSRTMKKILAAAGLGAAIVVGSLASAGTASASEVGFIQDLNNHGVVTYDAVQTLRWGHAICTTLNDYTGVPVTEAFYQITNYDVPDRYTAWIWVESAVENLCPWHDHRGEGGGGGYLA